MNWKLMENNIPLDDLKYLCDFIIKNPVLTNYTNVIKFEEMWSKWVGVKHSVLVNSGGCANLLSLLVLRQKLIDKGYDEKNLGEVIVSSLNWVTDISSVMLCGFKPVFVDVNLDTLSMDTNEVIKNINDNTRAVMLTHLMGFNALSDNLIKACSNITLIEDCCESHGATYNGNKVGSYGDMSNFSFYYGHHMTTVEGGMVCTNNDKLFQMIRMYRSHGLVREATDEDMKKEYYDYNPEPSPEFVFAYPSFNFRSTEINAILGIRQMRHLEENIIIRRKNFSIFLDSLDSKKYKTDFKVEGNSNFGLIIILNDKDNALVSRITDELKKYNIAYRRGVAGGGNQLRQPYLKNKNYGKPEHFPNTEHVHFYGLYIGNHQNINEENIKDICNLLNKA